VKKVLFLLFTCLLLVAMVIPACTGGGGGLDLGIPAGAKTIKVGVIGPMQYIEGENHWWGAIMAAQKINTSGGFKVGDDTYYVDLIQADSNETVNPADAASAMEKLITVDKAQYVVGGFRTEAVFPMQEIAMDNKTIFMDCGAATKGLTQQVTKDYNRYKYFFRNTPFADFYLVNNTLYLVEMAGAIIKEDTGITRNLKAAVVSEGAEWADGMTNALNGLIPSKLHMDVVGTWRPSPTASELTAEMTAIQAADADIIVTTISGPVGIPYARSWGELKVPAASVGINVEAQNLGFFDATQKFGNYETTQCTYTTNAAYTPETLPFVNEFLQEHGVIPSYTAGTYDAIYALTEAITRAGALDSDSVVAALEQTDTTTATGAARFKYTSVEDAPQGCAHDVTYGPGFSTGQGLQWQDGIPLGVWPNPQYPPDETWKDVNYEGMVKWITPPLLLERLKAEAATQPAAPPPSEQPAAPPAEQPAAPPAGEQPAGVETSFPSATYTNDQYGFSLQYPKDWAANAELAASNPNYLAAFGVPNFIPGVTIAAFTPPYPDTKDGIIQSLKDMKNDSPKVLSDIKEETLADGSTAYTFKAGYVSSTGYEIQAYVLQTVKGDTQIRVTVYTIDAFSPYDETLFSEIAHTLTFK
jgi:branched-chain amino acid transport system substrate-binding protein